MYFTEKSAHHFFVLYGILAVCLSSCTSKTNSSSSTVIMPASGKATLKSAANTVVLAKTDRPKALKTQEALRFIKDNCGECHSSGKPLYAQWGLPEDDILLKDASWLESDSLNQTVYQALVNKFAAMEQKVDDLGRTPSVMPPVFKKEEEAQKLGGMIAWLEDSFPAVPKEAHIRFGEARPFTESQVKVNLSYKCNKLLTGKQFLFRFSEKALGSATVAAEANANNSILTTEELEAPAGEATRKKVVTHFMDNVDYQDEFENFALRYLAGRIANIKEIKIAVDPGQDANAQARNQMVSRDLQDEFYQLVKKYYRTVSYPQLFLMNKVMVSRNTAPLYDEQNHKCAVPPENTWSECTLSPVRANFFGTRGFLLAKPSSMFENNNNYGRGGDTFSTIFGEMLMANTDGLAGDDPKPIPDCLNVTKDKRWKYKEIGKKEGIAAWGAISIPMYGRVCQGCHLNRHLAAASVVFRPFGRAGEIISPDNITNADGSAEPVEPYKSLIQLKSTPADKKFHVYHTDSTASTFQPVDQKFYRDLLEELKNPEATCLPDPRDPLNRDKAVKTNSLAKYSETLIHQSDSPSAKVRGVASIRGLNRFLPSVFLNSKQTNLEVIAAVNNAFESGEGKLEPMLRAFFATETFGCSAE